MAIASEGGAPIIKDICGIQMAFVQIATMLMICPNSPHGIRYSRTFYFDSRLSEIMVDNVEI